MKRAKFFNVSFPNSDSSFLWYQARTAAVCPRWRGCWAWAQGCGLRQQDERPYNSFRMFPWSSQLQWRLPEDICRKEPYHVPLLVLPGHSKRVDRVGKRNPPLRCLLFQGRPGSRGALIELLRPSLATGVTVSAIASQSPFFFCFKINLCFGDNVLFCKGWPDFS